MRLRRIIVCVVLVSSFLAVDLSSTPHAAATGAGSTYFDVWHGGQDPDIEKFGSTYFVYMTGTNIPTITAPLPWGPYSAPVSGALTTLPDWAATSDPNGPGVWAPHVVQRTVVADGSTEYTMYFAVRNKNLAGDLHCIGIANSKSPYGPFESEHTVSICGSAGLEAIDPTLMVTSAGDRYLIYKQDNQNYDQFSIRAIQLDSSSGTTIAPGASSFELFGSNSMKMENPSLIGHGGKFWMFTAGNDYKTCSYDTDVWSATNFRGPWTYDHAVITSVNTGQCGPGAASLIDDGGVDRIAWQAWETSAMTKHDVWTGVIGWDSAGEPYLY